MSVRLLVGRQRRAWIVIAGCAVLCAGVGALTFVPNWIAFKNPLWPVSFSYAPLHIEWPGLISLAQACPDLPLARLVAQKYHVPTGGIGDVIARDYGYAVPWVLVPLAAVAPVVALRRRLSRAPDSQIDNLILVLAIGAALVALSPSVAIARYNVGPVAIAAAGACWLLDRSGGSRLSEGAVASALVLSLVPWVWSDWLFGVDLGLRDIAALHRHSAEARASMNVASFQMPASVAELREREVGPGDLVVFTQETQFVGVLWNHQMNSRVEYLPYQNAAEFLTRLEVLRPRWVVTGQRSPARSLIRGRPAQWEYVGIASRQDSLVAYRRR